MIQIAPEFDPRPLRLGEFLALLDRVPWMTRLGRPHPWDGQAVRIARWEDVPSQETLGFCAVLGELNSWEQALLASGAEEGEIRATLARIGERTEALAKVAFPDYDPEHLGWSNENTAVMQACNVASWVGMHLHLGRPVPANALRQWGWLAEGHWPIMYDEDHLVVTDDMEGIAFPTEVLESTRLVVF